MGTISVFRAKPPAREGWRTAFSYPYMRSRSPSPLEIKTPYRENWQTYVQHLARLQSAIGPGKLEGKQALIIGPGSEPIEAGLVMGAFPKLAALHMADWHEPNIDKLEETLTQWAEQQPLYDRVKLHLSDAVNLEAIPAGSIHLVYMHRMIEYVEGWGGSYPESVPQKILDIFRLGAKRVLVPGGFLFTLGLKVTPQLADALDTIGFGRLQEDIWRRVA